jgi:hypothetical protein
MRRIGESMIYTEKQLSEMSDLEINMAVAEKAYRTEGYDTEFPKVFSDESSVGWLWLSKVSPAYHTCGIGFFRPCENWNDIMPIAEKYKIGVQFNIENGTGMAMAYKQKGSVCKNPKRAICEVFLMIDIDS